MSITKGNLLTPSDIGNIDNDISSKSLFARINYVRSVHAAVAQQGGNTTAYNALAASYDTSQVSSGAKVDSTFISNIKTQLNHLYTNSPWITTDYGAGIVIPTKGNLIYPSDLSVVETSIRNVEGITASNTAYYASGYHAGNYGYNGSSYHSGNYGFNGSSYNGSGHNGSHNGSYNGSRFCGSYSSSRSGFCRYSGFN